MDEEHLKRLAKQAEAFLFVEGGTLSKKKLSQHLGIKDAELTAVLQALSDSLHGRGLSLVQTEGEVSLATSAETAGVILKSFERELAREIGDAGLEVLAIVLYLGPQTRSAIDYIRGVNTSSTIRTLLSRGLLERDSNPQDGREYLYRPTAELLAHLGVKDSKELPEYDKIASELAARKEIPGIFEHNDGNYDTPDGGESA
jgi:segregation and condensation protein B